MNNILRYLLYIKNKICNNEYNLIIYFLIVLLICLIIPLAIKETMSLIGFRKYEVLQEVIKNKSQEILKINSEVVSGFPNESTRKYLIRIKIHNLTNDNISLKFDSLSFDLNPKEILFLEKGSMIYLPVHKKTDFIIKTSEETIIKEIGYYN